jgi:hypothetical protein
VVQIDEAHFNFHTLEGRYAPFAKLLRRDGYVVQSLAEAATADSLGQETSTSSPTPSPSRTRRVGNCPLNRHSPRAKSRLFVSGSKKVAHCS